MSNRLSRRIEAQIAAMELRALLFADCFISLKRRDLLIGRAANLIKGKQQAAAFRERLTQCIRERFGRNPDNFEVSPSVREALLMLNAAQKGKFRELWNQRLLNARRAQEARPTRIGRGRANVTALACPILALAESIPKMHLVC